jgi:hypothetical protein
VCLHHRRLRGDLDLLRERADLHYNVECRALAHLQDDSRLNKILKAAGLHLELVRPNGKIREYIPPGLVGDGAAYDLFFNLRGPDFRVDQGATALVGNRAANFGYGDCLSVHRRRQRKQANH